MKYRMFVLAFICASSFAMHKSREGGCMPTENMKLLISRDQISQRVKEIAAKLDQDYEGKRITLVMVMKGAVCITADLLREIKTPCSLEFVQASSYGHKTEAGQLTLTGLEKLTLANRNVLLIDDIYDTGATLLQIKKQLAEQAPASLKTLVMLLKNKERKTPEVPDYVLFDIENKFVLGNGLDYDELYRGLPGIYVKQ